MGHGVGVIGGGSMEESGGIDGAPRSGPQERRGER